MAKKKEATSEEIDTQIRTFLLGNMVSVVMKHVKGISTEWNLVDEFRQKEFLYDLTNDLKEELDKGINVIKADLHTSFRAKVDSVTFKDGVKATLVMPNTKASHELADVQGSDVLIVLCDNKVYLSEEGIPEAEKDQGSLNIEE